MRTNYTQFWQNTHSHTYTHAHSLTHTHTRFYAMHYITEEKKCWNKISEFPLLLQNNLHFSCRWKFNWNHLKMVQNETKKNKKSFFLSTYSGSCNWSDTWSGLYKHFYTLYFSFTAVWCSKETVNELETRIFLKENCLHQMALNRNY